ncbi:hypothetical protein BAE44_0013385 [Dichanthelium oligosanthes]|uniref:WRKY domain-containing protein n=1 Tax=Dichanthelium oligosanthes TaxID=888268 RepID=A0A1E5VKF7_9POAL|nr:hypothetical protein BAE44_0013385 [Dichanthelium oligosanthes]
MERFIVGAQKSTNQLRAVLAKLLPAAGGARAGAGSSPSGSAVDDLLSDITDSLSQALASLRFGALDTQRPPGQSSTGGGGRRSAPRRSAQRLRMDGACRMIVLQNEVQDSYTWRKYGQKEILGARFPRSYFKCGRKSGCPARKHVQQSDANPSKLEITYLDAHTCDDPPPSSSSHIVPYPRIISTGRQRNAAPLAPVAAVPSAHQRYIGQPSSLVHFVPELMIASSNVRRTTGVLLPVAAAVPAALSSTQYDPVPDDDTTFTPSMEEEQAEVLFIPSPACSQSELLPTEDAKVELHGPPLWMEHEVERATISDFMVVPEL